VEAIFEIKFDSEGEAGIVRSSIEPEAKIPKTKVTIGNKGNFVKLRIMAKDSSSLRAACNSYLRWIGLSSEIYELASENK
jgi:tRNA threonylcarbamoyladenosine modification (KEOPS) complex  Pcc1 subunit